MGQLFTFLAFVFLVLISQINLIRKYDEKILEMGLNENADILLFIEENTTPADEVLFIEAETAYNFLSRRKSPTRFVYQYTIQLIGSRKITEAFFYEVLENQPILIVDARGKETLDEKLYPFFREKSDYVRESIEYLTQTYQPVFYAESGWVVYARMP